MSEADQAQELEIEQWAITNRSRPPLPTFKPGQPGYGPAHCEGCDEPMPAVRRSMGTCLCTECTQITDRLRRNRRVTDLQ